MHAYLNIINPDSQVGSGLTQPTVGYYQFV